MKTSPLTIALIVLGVLGLAGLKYAEYRSQSRWPQGRPATIARINQIQPGMTPSQVQAIFGVPGWSPTPSPGSTVTTMSWTNNNLSGVGVVFENGHVINIVRSGVLPNDDSDSQ